MMYLEEPIQNVIREISQNDDMFGGNEMHYFSVGQSALKCISLALRSAGKEIEGIRHILDLPCGYGRVLRSLKAAFPDARLTACDLNKEGVRFCEQVFGATPVYSNPKVDEIPLEGTFDLIWCGSLLTHLDEAYWKDFLKFFTSVLSLGGVLVFSVHGRWVIEKIISGEYTYGLEEAKLSYLLDEYRRKGFGYVDYKGSGGYGISVSSPSFVLSLIEKISDLRVLSFIEKGWDNHQDVICCIKDRFMDITAGKMTGINRVQLSKEKQYSSNSEKIRLKPNQKYRVSTKAACSRGELFSAYFAVFILDAADNEIARYIRWFRNFSGEQKEYSVVFTSPADSVNAITGYRINVETSARADFDGVLSALSTVTCSETKGIDEFDDINEVLTDVF